MHQRSDRTASLAATPGLAGLLTRVGRRLRTAVWYHGLGTIAAAVSLWLLFSFLADWGLHVPPAVRLFHFAVLLALPVFFAWRGLVRPFRSVPGPDGLAVLVEREHPDLHELLVSAAQLQRIPADDPFGGDPVLRQRVLAAAEERATSLDLARVVDDRPPKKRLAAGLASVAVVAILFALNGELAGIFFDRMVGGSRPWPQRTQLLVDVGIVGESAQVTRGPGRIEVRLARGGDVPIIVTAEGEVPEDVTLRFDDGQELVLASGGSKHFRHTLRSCQEDLAFHVTGGDDLDGEPTVSVVVLQPPDVSGLAVRVEPPAYSGLEPSLVYDRDVEVLAGSRLVVHVLPDPADAIGNARVLPEDRVVALAPAPYPLPPGGSDAGVDPDGADAAPRTAPGLSFELDALASLRYRIELTDDTGLSNPDPGLFAVRVVEDRPPDLLVLSPGRADFETVRSGVLSLRVRAEDDFGLGAFSWSATPFLQEEVPRVGASLDLVPLPREETSADAPGAPRAAHRALARARIEVAELAPPGTTLAEGQQYTLTFEASDNRLPEASTTTSSAVRVRIVTADDLLRRVQDRLARARLTTDGLADLQREKRTRVEELLESLKSDSPLEGGDALALQSALAGQRRVQGDAEALTRELASITETVLYARLDEKAGPLLERLDRALATVADRRFHPEVWRALVAARQEAPVGSPGVAAHLVDILALALEISEEHATGAAAALDRAQSGVGMADVLDALVEAAELQTETLARLEDLLERLAEWDNFQSVLTLTRDILDRQKDLLNQLKTYASDR